MKPETLGIYLSIPFCKAKCSFCNFASGVFAADRMDAYVDRLCAELRDARRTAESLSATLPHRVDTVYFGGGTPSLLEPQHLANVFAAIRENFAVDADAEITLEAAPGQIASATLTAAQHLGVNRVSLGVQSFIDRESAAVGRSHTGVECHAEIARLRASGVASIGVDLIAGLPYQTAGSWAESVDQSIRSGVDHVSVYLLEVDEDSRLGREALTGGSRYHAPALPREDATADWYDDACQRLAAHGLAQYEISNFARTGFASRHNLKYWRREPYLGVGLDAHSMLPSTRDGAVAVRRANPDEMHEYLAEAQSSPLRALARHPTVDWIDARHSFEESLFLGLRLNAGVDLDRLQSQYGAARIASVLPALAEAQQAGLVIQLAENLRLTPAGRLASNEVFARLLAA